MAFQELQIAGVWLHTPARHTDQRGHFEEQFKLSEFEVHTGRSLVVQQVNQSVSNKGVVRGIHVTLGEVGQAKYVSCVGGRIWDVVVDLREGSPTFGKWQGVYLSPDSGISLFIPEGVGHSFLSLEEESIVNYLCSSEYNPEFDTTVSPMSRNLAIPFLDIAKQEGIKSLILSEKDANAPEFQPK